MSPDFPDQARSVAVEQLSALGLSTYAARTFVTLVGLGKGTAQDVSEISDVPGAQPFESLWDWSDTSAGRLLVVDQETTLVSVHVPGEGDHPTEPRDETAIRGTGPTTSLVVVLRTMFTGQLDGTRE